MDSQMSDTYEETQPVFREVQPLRQPWVWAIVVGVAALTKVVFVKQVILKQPFGKNPMQDSVLVVIWAIFGLIFPIVAFISKLITEVHSDGIYIRYMPFHWSFRRIGFEDIAHYEVRVYNPIREYGGWGIRKGINGTAYNVSGNEGVLLLLNSGKQILIGSQRPGELAQAIQSIKDK